MAVCQNLVPLVNIKIAGKWMFIPLKMVLIGIDPYPYSLRFLGFPDQFRTGRLVSFRSQRSQEPREVNSPRTVTAHEPRSGWSVGWWLSYPYVDIYIYICMYVWMICIYYYTVSYTIYLYIYILYDYNYLDDRYMIIYVEYMVINHKQDSWDDSPSSWWLDIR